MLNTNLINQVSGAPAAVDELMIYAWAQEHKARVGAYPHMGSGPVVSNETSAAGLKWSNINVSLQNQLDGLPPGLTLRSFIESHHRVFVPLNEKQILAWAAVHKKKYGSYPAWHYGSIEHKDADGDTWANINSALCFGLRGLEGGRTLAQFFDQHERSKNILSPELILQWADAYRDEHGSFPKESSLGTIPGTGFTWRDIDKALINGLYGLPKRKPRDDLWNFLDRNRRAGQLVPAKSQLSIKKIVDFALNHFQEFGEMPHALSGRVIGTHSETWSEIDAVLRNGGRGFAGGESLSEILDEFYPHDENISDAQLSDNAVIIDTPPVLLAPRRRGRPRKDIRFDAPLQSASAPAEPKRRGRPRKELPQVAVVSIAIPQEQVAPKKRGRPRKMVDVVANVPAAASSTHSVSNKYSAVTLEQILGWVDAHKQSEGYYPFATSGKIPGTDGKNWFGVQNVLKAGIPGVKVGTTLAKFIKEFRPRTSAVAVALVKQDERLESAEQKSGVHIDVARSVVRAPKIENYGEDFANAAMATHHARVSKGRNSEINEDNILKWIDNYFAMHGEYPRITSGKIDDESSVTWKAVAAALEAGSCGLPPGSLSKFIFDQYGVIGSKVVGIAKHKVFEYHA